MALRIVRNVGKAPNGFYLYRSPFGPRPAAGLSLKRLLRRGRGEVVAVHISTGRGNHSGYEPASTLRGELRGPLSRKQVAALGLA